jgi:hypothetical protein
MGRLPAAPPSEPPAPAAPPASNPPLPASPGAPPLSVPAAPVAPAVATGFPPVAGEPPIGATPPFGPPATPAVPAVVPPTPAGDPPMAPAPAEPACEGTPPTPADMPPAPAFTLPPLPPPELAPPAGSTSARRHSGSPRRNHTRASYKCRRGTGWRWYRSRWLRNQPGDSRFCRWEEDCRPDNSPNSDHNARPLGSRRRSNSRAGQGREGSPAARGQEPREQPTAAHASSSMPPPM